MQYKATPRVEFEGCASHSFQPALTSSSSGRKRSAKDEENLNESVSDQSVSAVLGFCVCVPGYQEVHDVNVKCICGKTFFLLTIWDT